MAFFRLLGVLLRRWPALAALSVMAAFALAIFRMPGVDVAALAGAGFGLGGALLGVLMRHLPTGDGDGWFSAFSEGYGEGGGSWGSGDSGDGGSDGGGGDGGGGDGGGGD